MSKKGVLYLIPTTLGNNDLDKIIPPENEQIISNTKVFIVENLRTARRFLKLVNRNINIDELTFFELNQHTDLTHISSYLKPIFEGKDVGILSEAGCPQPLLTQVLMWSQLLKNRTFTLCHLLVLRLFYCR